MPIGRDERYDGTGIEDGHKCVQKKEKREKKCACVIERDKDDDDDDDDDEIDRVHIYI